MKVISCVQGTPEWFSARVGVITASMFGVARSRVGGLDEKQLKYVTALLEGKTVKQAMLEAGYKSEPTSRSIRLAIEGKPVGRPSDAAIHYAFNVAVERISGEVMEDTYQTYAMRRGHELEGAGRLLYVDRTGSPVTETGVVVTDCGNFGYSSDGLVGNDGSIEIKTLMSAKSILPVFNHDLSEYEDQMQGGLMINEREWCDFVMYTPQLAKVSKDLFIKRIYRNDVYIKQLKQELADFNDYVWTIINQLAA